MVSSLFYLVSSLVQIEELNSKLPLNPKRLNSPNPCKALDNLEHNISELVWSLQAAGTLGNGRIELN